MCFCPGSAGSMVPTACNPCSHGSVLTNNDKRGLSAQQFWRDILAGHVSSQFDLLGIARVAPQPEDYENFGLSSFPSLRIHTRDHLHADGKIRIHGIQACQLDLGAIPRLATKIVDHLMRIDAHQPKLSELVKSTRQQAKALLENNPDVLLRGVFIDEVKFIDPEYTIYGRPEAFVFIEIRYAIKRMAALPSNDHTMIKCNLGHPANLAAFERALARIAAKSPKPSTEPIIQSPIRLAQ